MSDFCCKTMEKMISDGIVVRDLRYDTYSLLVRQNVDHRIVQDMFFCPWCSLQLPPSLRSLWFDELEAMGIDPMKDEIPQEYQTGEWRQGKTVK